MAPEFGMASPSVTLHCVTWHKETAVSFGQHVNAPAPTFVMTVVATWHVTRFEFFVERQQEVSTPWPPPSRESRLLHLTVILLWDTCIAQYIHYYWPSRAFRPSRKLDHP